MHVDYWQQTVNSFDLKETESFKVFFVQNRWNWNLTQWGFDIRDRVLKQRLIMTFGYMWKWKSWRRWRVRPGIRKSRQWRWMWLILSRRSRMVMLGISFILQTVRKWNHWLCELWRKLRSGIRKWCRWRWMQLVLHYRNRLVMFRRTFNMRPLRKWNYWAWLVMRSRQR